MKEMERNAPSPRNEVPNPHRTGFADVAQVLEDRQETRVCPDCHKPYLWVLPKQQKMFDKYCPEYRQWYHVKERPL